MGKGQSKKGAKGGGGADHEFDFDDVDKHGPLKDADVKRERQKCSIDDFELLKVVGKGSFGKVMQVKKKTSGKIYAMKILNKEKVISRKQFEHTLSERRILEEIDHPFLVGLHFAFQSKTKLYMVFDFFNGGELYHYISRGRFSKDRAKFYAAEILLGLEHLHLNNVVYRDLKPENLLLDASGHIRICDFGLSKENVKDDTVKSICGTPEYLAPEVIQRQRYGKAVDWWSLGTLIYEMIVGLPPFYDTNRQRMYRKILRDPLRKSKQLDAQAFDICAQMLKRNPKERLGYNGAAEIKKHAWWSSEPMPIDFVKLNKLEVEPPFKPKVKSTADTSNVDAVFTQEAPTVTPTPRDATVLDADTFKDFTFVKTGDGDTYSLADDKITDEHLPAKA